MNGKNLATYRVMRIVAYGHWRNDLFRLSKHCCIFFIGVLAMVLPPQNPQAQVSPLSLVITGGLFAISLLLIMASALDKKQRDALEDVTDEAR